MMAIGVGTAALIIVLSVFNGFEDLVKGLYADFYADMRIVPATGKSFHISPEQINKIKNTPGVAVISYVAEEKAVLNGAFQTIISLKGVDNQYAQVTSINTPQHIIRGKYDMGTIDAPKLVVGSGIENAAGLSVDKEQFTATIYLPNKQASKLIADDGLHAFTVTPAGTFAVQQDFDNKYAFTNLAFVKYMLGMLPDEFSALELKVTGSPEKVKARLESLLGKSLLVETRYEQNKSLYAVMQMEKWVIYGILSLILVVAAFNMIGALTMLVLEKKTDIAVLKAMGASEKKIQGIFLYEGLLLATLGGGSGVLLAIFICYLQINFHLIKLGGESFIIDYYPVKMFASDFLLVTTTVLIIALLAAWVPSRKASRQLFSLKS